MRLHLVRHGEAAQGMPDAERPLTLSGRDEVARLAEWCAANAVAPAEIRHSGLVRAEQTAKILGARLAPPGGVRAVRGLAPDDDPSMVADEIVHETEPVLLVTHMPFVAGLAAALVRRRAPVEFSTGSIASFERDGDAFRLAACWSPRS